MATMLYLVVDPAASTVRWVNAGHPPPLVLSRGEPRFLEGQASVPLGVLPFPTYEEVTARLDPGDALLLYTDGLVETPKRDITYGIDKLLGEAERLVQQGFVHGADRLVASVESESDDRALFLLHRR